MRRAARKRKLKRHKVSGRQTNPGHSGVFRGGGADECVIRHEQLFGVVCQYDFAADLVHPASSAVVELSRGDWIAGAVELRRIGVKTHRHELMRLGRDGDFFHWQLDAKAGFCDCFLNGKVKPGFRVTVVGHPDLPYLLPRLGQGQRAERQRGQAVIALRHRRHGCGHRPRHVEKTGSGQRFGIYGAILVQQRLGSIE